MFDITHMLLFDATILEHNQSYLFHKFDVMNYN